MTHQAPADECACCGFKRQLTFRYRLKGGEAWRPIDRFCRDRLVAVGDLYAFVRYLQKDLLRGLSTQSLFHEFCRLRRQIFFARIGCLPLFPTKKRFLSGLMDHQLEDPFELKAYSPTWSGGPSREELSPQEKGQVELAAEGLEGAGRTGGDAPSEVPKEVESSREEEASLQEARQEGEAWARFFGRLRGQRRGRRVGLEPIEELHEHGEGAGEYSPGEGVAVREEMRGGPQGRELEREEMEEEMEVITLSEDGGSDDEDEDDLVVDIHGQLPRLLEEVLREGAGGRQEEAAGRGGKEPSFFPGFSLPSRKESKISGLFRGGAGAGGEGKASNGFTSLSKLFQRTSPPSARKDLSFFELGMAR